MWNKLSVNSLVSLKILKESRLMEIEEYVTALNLETEPAFAWWVPYTLWKWENYCCKTFIGLSTETQVWHWSPKRYNGCSKTWGINGNTLWQDVYKNVMIQVGVAFTILRDDENLPVGWTKSIGHIVRDVKMEFTPDLDDSKYTDVISWESVRTTLTHAALLGMKC